MVVIIYFIFHFVKACNLFNFILACNLNRLVVFLLLEKCIRIYFVKEDAKKMGFWVLGQF